MRKKRNIHELTRSIIIRMAVCFLTQNVPDYTHLVIPQASLDAADVNDMTDEDGP